MALLTRCRRVPVSVALAAAVFVCTPSAQMPGAPGEDDVKAAYVFNFTKFVQWPAAAFAGPSDPLTVCAVGDVSVRNALQRILSGEVVDGRPLRLVLPATDSAAGCHVLFVGRGGAERGMRLMMAAGSAPMLTVGDSPRFLQQGGMISFVVEERRVRFDVSLAAAERAGLKLSSKLLRVARHVRRSQDTQ